MHRSSYIRGQITSIPGLAFALLVAAPAPAFAATMPPPLTSAILFENVRVFDGHSSTLSGPANVLIVGNTIRTISSQPVTPPADARVTRIAGNGRTLMPGLIAVHVHLTFGALSQAQLASPDLTPEKAIAASAREAEQMLLRGFTSVRDVGGPIFDLKRMIDSGKVAGPRAASPASRRARSCWARTSSPTAATKC
jgi:imidazolonepropionase-like amidohydrolase